MPTPSGTERAVEFTASSCPRGRGPSRPVPGGFLPLLAAWGLSPALLLGAGGCFSRIGGAGSAARAIGAVLGVVALLGTPALFFSWGAFLLRRRRVANWPLVVTTMAALLLAANAALAFGIFALIEIAF